MNEAARSGAERWNETETQNDCNLQPNAKNVPQFNDFLTIKYPKFVKDRQFIESISRLEDQMYNSIQEIPYGIKRPYAPWASNLSDDEIQVEDPYVVEQWGHTLYTYWDSNWRAHNKSGTEMDVRYGIDGLLKLAFEVRLGARHAYKTERDLFLPRSPVTSTADGITTMMLPDDWIEFLNTLQDSYIFASQRDMGEVITFAYEAKCVDVVAASRQLTLYLCSAQHQRRALCFSDGPIYGATIVGDRFTMYSSEWVGDKVAVSRSKLIFDLGTFPAFIKCYLFLCRVADHLAEEVDKVFQGWKSEDTKREHQDALRAKSNGPRWRLLIKPKSDRKGLGTLSYLGDSDVSGSGSVQDEMEYTETEDWELTGEGVNNKHPSLVTEGDRLVRASLQVLDEAYDADLDGESIHSGDGIRQWAQTIIYEL